MVRVLYHGRMRRAAPWDCGFPLQTSRMQDTAEGFGQPIRHIFEPFFRIVKELPTPSDAAPRYRIEVGDRLWHALYLPLASLVRRTADFVGIVQQGRIGVYLIYSFVTLLSLLLVVM
jgi:hypothetical protein